MMLGRYLVLAIASLLCKPALSQQVIACNLPISSEVVLDNNEKLFVYDADILVKYERNNLAIYDYPESNDVNFLINKTIVAYSERYRDLNGRVSETGQILFTQIAGTAKLMRNEFNHNKLTECNVYLSRDSKGSTMDLSVNQQVFILHKAASCVREVLCNKLGIISNEDVQKSKKHPFSFGALSVFKKIRSANSSSPNFFSLSNITTLATSLHQLRSNNAGTDGLQSTINVLVDLAISEFVRIIKQETNGAMKIPDINEKFSDGNAFWKPTGEFNAIGGVFTDLTTLIRTDDAHLSHTGLKFIASGGFGLSKAHINYDKYKVKYGFAKVSGQITADINGVALSTRVAVDYNQKPCRAILEELRVTKLGTMKVKMTGLGPLNKLMSKLATWITKKWKEEIVHTVEERISDLAREHLNDFDCEKFRP